MRKYWIAGPMDQTVEVFVLRNGIYELLGRFGAGERVRSEELPGFQPATDEIFAVWRLQGALFLADTNLFGLSRP